jgi:glycosyltransferase involved in cell wall biosynthesis
MNSKKTRASAKKYSRKPVVVFLSSLSHRRCGIAKFTRDLFDSANILFGETVDFKRIAVINETDEGDPSTKNFICLISKDRQEDYRKCAQSLNQKYQVKLVNIQHEFGLFGGDYGNYILSFLREIRKPIIFTFHTVQARPDQTLLSLVKKIGRKAKKIVVMTKDSRRILVEEYGLLREKISVMPHGIPSFHYENDNKQIKKELGLANKVLIFTHGFLSRNKGIEYVIEALPEVVNKYPNVVYLLAGRTHPNVKLNEGESYRQSLLEKVKELGIENNVQFINRYISTPELVDYLKACDIYISTSLDPNQAVSGTFAYALGSGRPIISTAFSHSKEELKKGRGILVKPRDPKSYEKALLELLGDEKARSGMGMSCYFKTRNMTWENVALSYGRLFSEYVPNVGKSLILPPAVLAHLFRMTDDFGLLQFAKFIKPLKRSGYTVDDNARALVVTGLYYSKHQEKAILRYLRIYLNFLEYTINKTTGYFRNYVKFNRIFNQKRNQVESYEDPTARALYALARTTATSVLPPDIRNLAGKIFKQSMRKQPKFIYTRSVANCLKALYYYLPAGERKKIKAEIVYYADILCSRYNEHSSGSWTWFEDALIYSNGVIPQSLFYAYLATGKSEYLDIANKATDFLIKHSFKNGVCVPIGQKYWFRKGGKRSFHDQQPEEVASLVELLNTSFRVNRELKYKDLMISAYNWFLGNNMLGQVVCDFKTGGCYDGVGEREVNLNQGAESTLSYLTARLIVSRR